MSAGPGPGSTPRLAAAHLGYDYQDIVGASLLAVGLVEGLDYLATELPRGNDTFFDDLERRDGAGVLRWQVKHSTDPARKLGLADLRPGGDLALQRMLAATGADPRTADQFRLLLTWSEPSEERLGNLLVVDQEIAPSLPGAPSRRYRFDPNWIWPEGGEPNDLLDLPAGTERSSIEHLCENVVVELGAPTTSLVLAAPGDAEAWLLSYLETSVGVSRAPNLLDPEVATDLLIRMAARGRPRSGAIGLDEVRQKLGLKSAFGRLEQLSPVEPDIEVPRRRVGAQLLRVARGGSTIVITAGPGLGKSWTIEELSRLATRGGAVVARHYCYLRPDDTSLQERVRGDQMVVNLVAELLDRAPELSSVGASYAADLQRLEELLDANAEADDPRELLLIVDGLDHIGRIRAQSQDLSDVDIDIVERLASLSLPEHSHLLVLSQPGAHLAPLEEEATALELPPWEPPELEALSGRVGLGEDRLHSTPAVIAQGRRLCAEWAAGSPLYCTYLSRELIGLLGDDPDADVEAAVANMPPAGSELAAYYEYLLADAERFPGARQVAYLLALVDFALTAQDMKEILGALAAGDVEGALAALRPLLTEVGTEAAFRAHHESFQRFVIDRLASAGTPVSAVLEPLVTWLEDRGFLEDARAFRHLLPSLRRSGRGERVLELVSPSFVAEAVANGHPYLATKANIDTAAAAAAGRLDLAGLARFAELARAAASTYEDNLYSIEKFATAIVAAHGALGVAERLIHEGRPTWPRRAGMYLCRASDLAGGVPPWGEYLDLPRHARENLMGDEEEEEAADRCGWLGRLRLAEDPKGMAISILRSEVDTIDAARELLRYLAEVCGAELIAEVAPMLREGKPRMAAWLELAKAFDGDAQAEQRRQAAEFAAGEEGPASLLSEALDRGADPGALSERLGSVESLASRARDLSQLDYIHESEPLEEYRLELRVHGAAGADLEPVRLAVEGGGWWQDFLRFCVDEARGGIDGDPLAALRRLTVNAHPYAGTPRAMDLYSLKPEIARTINAVGGQVRAEARGEALELLTLLARKTGGAYNLDAELDFCESQMESDAELFGDRAIARIEEDLAGGEHLYEEAAGLCQRLAAIHLRRSEEELAQAAWTRAATYLAGYGFRKDITFYELLEGLDDLAVADREGALRRAIEIQPFASLVVQHTDGKETSRMPSAWFRRLCALSPAIAAQCLAQSFRRVDGNADYRVEEALGSLLSAAAGDPRLTEAIGATANHSTADRRAAVEALLGTEGAEGERALLRLIAATDGDGANPDEDGIAELESLAASHGIETEERRRVNPVREASANDYSSLGQNRVPERSAFFPTTAGVGGLLHAIRTIDLPEQSDEQDRFVLSFGYRMLQLAQNGDRPGASRLLRTFARKRFLRNGEEVLEQLADGFERHGEASLAAQALTLSWTAARRNWWTRTGGANRADHFIRAKQLDAELSERTLCVELAEIIRVEPTQYGLSQGVIGLLVKCGDAAAAVASWDAAASVITGRLPALGREIDYFAAAAEQDPDLDLDAALSYLLASRLCHPRCPISHEALAGLGRLASADPVATALAVSFLLEADTPDFAVAAVLQVARDSPHAAEIATALEEQLTMVAEAGGIATAPLASELLTTAALPVPEADRGPALVVPTLAIAPGKTAEAILSLDFDDQVQRLEAKYEGLADEVAAAFDRRWRNSETAESREKRRIRLAHTTSDDPPAEVRLWAEDLFQGSLEEALAPRLEGAEDAALAADTMRYDVDTVIRWVSSRTPRPSPAPHTEVDPAPLEEGRYSGWWRLGWVEKELNPRDCPMARDFRVSDRMGAIVFSDRPLPRGSLPFGQGEAADWQPLGRTAFQGSIDPGEPLCGLSISRDTWGKRTLLMLPAPLAVSLSLALDPGDRFALVDREGEEAVRYRRWWVRALRDEGSSAWVPRVSGCDLIVRDDIWSQISNLAEEDPHWSHHEIGATDAEEP